MTEAGNPPKTKTGGFPASLESAIPPRFPHSHRPCGCYIGFKIQGPKAKPERRSLSSAPVPFPFRLILQLEKTVSRLITVTYQTEFGGAWTQKKLDALKKYLRAYTKIFK